MRVGVLVRCGWVRPLKMSWLGCDLFYWLWKGVEESNLLGVSVTTFSDIMDECWSVSHFFNLVWMGSRGFDFFRVYVSVRIL